MVGQDKPLISPYQPDSLAEVGIPPLAGAGNLWLWLPQARYEERVHLGANSGFTGQVALLPAEKLIRQRCRFLCRNARESANGVGGAVRFLAQVRRQQKNRGCSRLPPQHHACGGPSINSRIGSLDWSFKVSSHLEWKGTVFNGQNVAGLGALGNGFTITSHGYVQPVKSSGGWSQLAFPLTNRLTVNLFGGLEDDRSAYQYAPGIAHNFTYASNIMYHLGPNVLLSLEVFRCARACFRGWARFTITMTWQSAICSRILAVATVFSAQLLAGAVAGHVRLVDSRDSSVKKHSDFSNVVVWLTSPETSPARVPRKHAQMLQKDKKFSPHILAIATGTSVDFPNLDPIFHNAFSNFNGQIFDVALYPPGSSKSVPVRPSGHREDLLQYSSFHVGRHRRRRVQLLWYDEADGSFSLPNVAPAPTQSTSFTNAPRRRRWRN